MDVGGLCSWLLVYGGGQRSLLMAETRGFLELGLELLRKGYSNHELLEVAAALEHRYPQQGWNTIRQYVEDVFCP